MALDSHGWDGYEDLLEEPKKELEPPLVNPELYRDGRMIEALAPVDFNGRWVYE